LEEIDDVVQEAFVRLLSQRPQWDDNSSMRFWLFRVVRNLAIDRHRSVFRRYATSLQADSFLSPNPPATLNSTPEDDCLRNEQLFLIEENLSKLTVRQRYAIGLWMQGLTYHEIGRTLESSTHTVEELLRRGFIRLREAVRGSAK
jgi:RNA polymerase sigma-70 factor (ECF subfamily)